MNDYLSKIQKNHLIFDIQHLFYECRDRYLSSAELVGKYNDEVRKLYESQRYESYYLVKIVQLIHKRYNDDYCDDQMEILESFEQMVERRWYAFSYKLRQALVLNNTFCKCCLQLAGYLSPEEDDAIFSTAMQIVHNLDLRWYLSDEPKKTDEDEKL
jgi:hypothetical protein